MRPLAKNCNEKPFMAQTHARFLSSRPLLLSAPPPPHLPLPSTLDLFRLFASLHPPSYSLVFSFFKNKICFALGLWFFCFEFCSLIYFICVAHFCISSSFHLSSPSPSLFSFCLSSVACRHFSLVFRLLKVNNFLLLFVIVIQYGCRYALYAFHVFHFPFSFIFELNFRHFAFSFHQLFLFVQMS